jgi:hypothetical protein
VLPDATAGDSVYDGVVLRELPSGAEAQIF